METIFSCTCCTSSPSWPDRLASSPPAAASSATKRSAWEEGVGAAARGTMEGRQRGRVVRRAGAAVVPGRVGVDRAGGRPTGHRRMAGVRAGGGLCARGLWKSQKKNVWKGHSHISFTISFERTLPAPTCARHRAHNPAHTPVGPYSVPPYPCKQGRRVDQVSGRGSEERGEAEREARRERARGEIEERKAFSLPTAPSAPSARLRAPKPGRDASVATVTPSWMVPPSFAGWPPPATGVGRLCSVCVFARPLGSCAPRRPKTRGRAGKPSRAPAQGARSVLFHTLRECSGRSTWGGGWHGSRDV